MREIFQLCTIRTRIFNLLQYCTSANHIHQIQGQLVLQSLHGDTRVAYHFIAACQSVHCLDLAFRFYTVRPRLHVFVCNSLIRAFCHSHTPRTPLAIYNYMQKNSILPNNYTFPFLFKSLSDFHDFKQAQCIHTHVVKLGHVNDIYVRNSLLDVYASCGHMNLCRRVFDEMLQRDVVSWTVLIMGYRIACKYDDALIVFEQMQYAGVVPNHVTMVNALSACANFGAIEMGCWIHDIIRRNGWELDVILGTSLIDMYAKCGRMEEGLGVFGIMKEKNIFTWNTLIKGLALAKSGEEAVWWFNRMEQEGFKADEVTLIAVLAACSHSGLLVSGRHIFCSLVGGKYEFSPNVKHYACFVDLLGRAGRFQEAFKFVRDMPFEPTKVIWGSLLYASKAQGNLEFSEFSARKLVELEPHNSAYYVVLSNLYAEMGRWSDVEKVRRTMLSRGLTKDLGSSSVELFPQEKIHELVE
ncbi:Pentatricopeptide repeat-containing protein [Quillaja saponaria]|uniref:Pentatricopeptide repeat-containing protein n=1 Tax=Quillaja saponaria TaxID=32244 RepID=A0AAD7QA44_QUISA|nr:Pentatricopeptide repeat-containing protein [Quillaja saponaria]